MRSSLFLALLLFAGAPTPADDRSDAERDLQRAIAARDEDATRDALARAIGPGDERAARTLLRLAPGCRGLNVHEALLEAIAGISDEAGVEALVRAADTHRDPELRYLLVEGLARQGSEPAAEAVLEALDDRSEIVAIIAARSARRLPKPATVAALVARLEKSEGKANEAALVRELLAALTLLTGQDIPTAAIWKSWWSANEAGWTPPADPEDDGSGRAPRNALERMKKDRPAESQTITQMPQDQVIVVRGGRDKIGDVLDAIGVPHKDVRADDIASMDLDPRAVLILNCNGTRDPYTEAEYEKIRRFVGAGGYLFTSDWILSNTLQKIFPRTIISPRKTDDRKDEVSIVPAAPRHPLLRDVFPMTTWTAPSYTWKLDTTCEMIDRKSPHVTVLVESPELQKRFKLPAVAVTFRWYGNQIVSEAAAAAAATRRTSSGSAPPQPGAVLHVMGHFEMQKDPDAGDHFALQQLLLNFILEKQLANRGG